MNGHWYDRDTSGQLYGTDEIAVSLLKIKDFSMSCQ